MKHRGYVVIPARLKSTRFPGKPLVKVNGKPMVQLVYERCVQAVGPASVYVATDAAEIKDTVEGFSGNVVMTSEGCLTGTDRLAEANNSLNADFIVNVQGDEPMINPEDVRMVFKAMQKDFSFVLNCYCAIDEDEKTMASVPKVVMSRSNRLLYISRSGIPFDKNLNSRALFKQVCIYGYSKKHLKIFEQHQGKSANEAYEDIEILRFLEMDIQVQMLRVSGGTYAVDTPADLKRVEQLLSRKNEN